LAWSAISFEELQGRSKADKVWFPSSEARIAAGWLTDVWMPGTIISPDGPDPGQGRIQGSGNQHPNGQVQPERLGRFDGGHANEWMSIGQGAVDGLNRGHAGVGRSRDTAVARAIAGKRVTQNVTERT
jgi:hypothetical protein